MDKNQGKNQENKEDNSWIKYSLIGFLLGAFGAISWIPSVSQTITRFILDIF